MVVEKDEDTAPMNHEFYEQKGLIQRWAEGNRPSIRIGTVHTLQRELSAYLSNPAVALAVDATRSMTIECPY